MGGSKLKSLCYHVKALLLNILTCFLNLFIRRDDSVWVFGSWMGKRFADNSRYLFQYLSEEGSKYGIQKTIWITRNREVLGELRLLGYNVFLAKSAKGIYYHLKAGVHVVCNMAYTNGRYEGDINGNLSSGAVKIQLWHGFPIKANVKKTGDIKPLRARSFLYRLTLPGRWSETQYVVSTSKECSKRYRKWFSDDELRTIECGYPRNCSCLQYTNREKEILAQVTKHKKSILYLPTFRDGKVSFEHPLTNSHLVEWLNENDILWVEKPHLVSTMGDFFGKVSDSAQTILLRLEGDFDVNVLLPIVSLVVTDYSSVSVDAIYFNRPVVYYIPDFDQYCGSDRGLTDGFDNVSVGEKIKDINEMIFAIQRSLDKSSDELEADYAEIKTLFFDGRCYSFEQMMKEILGVIRKSNMKRIGAEGNHAQ